MIIRCGLAIAASLLASSCVFPDPYYMQVFCPIDAEGPWVKPPYPEASHGPYLVNGEYVRVWILDSGLNEGESYPPYRVVVDIHAGLNPVTRLTIRDVALRLNGNLLTGVDWRRSRTKASVSLPVTIAASDLYSSERPGFRRLGLVTDEVVYDHHVGDTLAVDVSLVVVAEGITHEASVNWTFEGRVHRGILRADGYVGDPCK